MQRLPEYWTDNWHKGIPFLDGYKIIFEQHYQTKEHTDYMTDINEFKSWKDFWLEYFTEDTQALSIMIGVPPAVAIDGIYRCDQTDEPVTRHRYYHELEKVLLAPGKWEAFLEGEEMTYTHTEDGATYQVTFNNGYRAMAKITRILNEYPA